MLNSGKMSYMEYYKANNFLEIAKKADKYLKGNSVKKTETTYEFDWFVRYYEASGNVSDEEVQELWARLLAGEICQNRRYSLKLLDILKNMGKQDAKLFTDICAHSFSDGTEWFIPNNDTYLDSHGIFYHDIMLMSELGLMSSNGMIHTCINTIEDPSLYCINGDLAMCISAKGNGGEQYMQFYPFTRAGNELASLIKIYASSEDFVGYAKILQIEKPECRFHIYKIIEKNGDSLNCDEKDLLSGTEEY